MTAIINVNTAAEKITVSEKVTTQISVQPVARITPSFRDVLIINNGGGGSGTAATIEVGTVTTVAPTEPATIINSGTSSKAVFDFEIPQGYSGANGLAATLTVGTVTTVASTASAEITNSGTTSAAIFDFKIPQGTKGDTGDTGAAGKDGANGLDGFNSLEKAAVTVSGNYIIDLSQPERYQQVTASGNFTLSVINAPAGYLTNFNVLAVNWGAHVITLPAGVKQPFAANLTFTPTGADLLQVSASSNGIMLKIVDADIRVVSLTNLCQQPNVFFNPSWVSPFNNQWAQVGVTVTAGVLSYDGTNSASRIIETATTGNHAEYYTSGTALASNQYTFAIYARKNAGTRFIRLSLSSGITASFLYADFNIDTGAVVKNSVGVQTSITPAANGYYLIQINCVTVVKYALVIFITSEATPAGSNYGYESYTGNTGNSFDITNCRIIQGATFVTE